MVIVLVIILICSLLTLVWLNRRRFRNIQGRLLSKKCERLVLRGTTNDMRYTLKLIRKCQHYVYELMVYEDISEFRFISHQSLFGTISKLQKNIKDLYIILAEQAVTSDVNPAGFSQAEIDELRRSLELLKDDGDVKVRDNIQYMLTRIDEDRRPDYGADRCPKCGFMYGWNGYECGHCHYGE